MTAPFYRRPPVRRSAIMWNFFRRMASPAKRPTTSRDRARPLSPPGRLQVERLEGRFSPGGLFGSALDLSLEAAALFWQGPGAGGEPGPPAPGIGRLDRRWCL